MRALHLFLFVFLFVQLVGAHPKREMRGAWIATVANIDWPISADSSSQAKERELVALIDSLDRCGINTVIFQVRPTSDALFFSELEPWSEWLTGTQGKCPNPFFDPLAVVVDEAHKRCMEVHAWVNPYRVANFPETVLYPNHLFYKKPHLFKSYGGRIFFDPGLDETADYLLKILADIVERYDIDALHLDDYFYPYPAGGKDFPDQETFKANPRGFRDKGEWRRDNVNRIVRRIQDTVKTLKPWVQFGVSPFGVWRNESDDPRGSKTKAGVTNYDDLFADVLLWERMGWVDYLTPQLYWELGKKVADYAVLAPWWEENVERANLYFGLFASGLEINKGKAWRSPNELIRQMRFNQECVPNDGVMFYSTSYFLKNLKGLHDSLRADFFRYPALTPVVKGGNSAEPPRRAWIDGDTLRWEAIVVDGGDAVSAYLVYAFPDSVECDFDDPRYILTKTASPNVDLTTYPMLGEAGYLLFITAVNRYRQESEPETFVFLPAQYKDDEDE